MLFRESPWSSVFVSALGLGGLRFESRPSFKFSTNLSFLVLVRGDPISIGMDGCQQTDEKKDVTSREHPPTLCDQEGGLADLID